MKSWVAEDFSFIIRSYIARETEQRQWELGKRLELLRTNGAKAQLKFPASLRVVWNNKTYNYRNPENVDCLIEQICLASSTSSTRH